MDRSNHSADVEASPWDVWGLVLSSLCLIHCLLTPLALLILPSLVPHWLRAEGHGHHWFYIGLVAVALFSVTSGFRRHRNWSAAGWLLSGLVVVGFSTFALDGNWEYSLTVLGSGLLLRGHYLNRQYCRLCQSLPEKPVCCEMAVIETEAQSD